jgi:DNA-binding transcriptional regulator YdaS (Cro superfamily)
MTLEDLQKHYGTQVSIAQALGIAQSSVSGWFQSGRIPDGRQYQIELATEGALRADKPALRQAIDAA